MVACLSSGPWKASVLGGYQPRLANESMKKEDGFEGRSMVRNHELADWSSVERRVSAFASALRMGEEATQMAMRTVPCQLPAGCCSAEARLRPVPRGAPISKKSPAVTHYLQL